MKVGETNMAFTVCKKCNSSVSAEAVVCPVCRHPLGAPKDVLSVTMLKWLIGVSMAGFVYHLAIWYWS